MPGIAAIDIGSNAIRLAVAFIDRRQAPLLVEEIREPIRLGDEVFKRHVISEDALRRAEAAFSRFRTILGRHSVDRVRTVATSALREAHNRGDFLARIKQASGIDVEVISGEEEARLIFEAVARSVPLKGKLALLLDIGGGSVEVSIVRNGEILFSESLKLGAVRLLEIFRGRPQAERLCARLVRGYVDGLRRRLKRELRGRAFDFCIGTGGNIEELGDLREVLCGKRGNREVQAKEIERIMTKLARLDVAERVSELGLRPDRADVIVPAGIIVREVMRHSGIKKLLVPRVGLKNGVLWELAGRGKKRSPVHERRHARLYAIEVGRRFDFDEAHGVAVAQWALRLFRDLQSIHRLPAELSGVLEIAALLHDIGHVVNVNGHHKHSYYLIQASPLLGLTDEERRLVACIARYHRKSFPKLDHPEFAALPPESRAIVSKLAAILRLADACDCGHARAVRAVRTKVTGRSIELAIRGDGDLLLERWALGRKADLFEFVYGVQVTVR